jgi:hypothetical protein
MIAHKFLAPGGVAPFSGFVWPTGSPGPWVEARPSPCASGIHACAVEDLPYWLHSELWQIELDGGVRLRHKLVAPRGRLVRRVETWDAAAGQAFAEACAARAAKLAARAPEVEGYAADAATQARNGLAATTGFVAARAAELALGPEGYERERAAQSGWLAERLGL